MAASSRSASSSSSGRRCPHCNGRAVRVERVPGDMELPDADAWRRYRCRNEACRWEGLLEAHRHRRSALEHEHAIPRALRIGFAAVGLLVLAGLTWGLLQVLSGMIEN